MNDDDTEELNREEVLYFVSCFESINFKMTLLIDEKTVIMCPLLFYSFICRLHSFSCISVILLPLLRIKIPSRSKSSIYLIEPEPISIEIL